MFNVIKQQATRMALQSGLWFARKTQLSKFAIVESFETATGAASVVPAEQVAQKLDTRSRRRACS